MKRNDGYQTVIVIERDFSYVDCDLQYHYIGAPCHSFEEARELVYAHRQRNCDFQVSYVNNDPNYVEINAETGEIVAEYYVRLMVDI